MRALQGKEVGMIFLDARTALNRVLINGPSSPRH